MFLKDIFIRSFFNYKLFVRLRNPYFRGQRATVFTGKSRSNGNEAVIRNSTRVTSRIQTKYEYARQVFANNLCKRATTSLASDIRKRTAKQMFGSNPPLFALIGVSVVTNALTEDTIFHSICCEIQDRVEKMKTWAFQNNEDLEEPLTLDSFEFGNIIAKGTNAVVYEAKLKNELKGIPKDERFDPYPLAIKMMFNYSAESNAHSILRAMRRELVPLNRNGDAYPLDRSFGDESKKLPSHSNVVAMYGAFVDYIPELPGSFSSYPDALPFRINPNGYGRNMSLFIVMKKYDTNLKDYLGDKLPKTSDGVLLLAQLLEAVIHLNRNGIAHRDIKCDNILLERSSCVSGCPNIVLTDFGCCSRSLKIPYNTPEIDKGGNTALMAPEVINAQPGMFSTIDYSKADVWTVGSIAYEIFTGKNPFYKYSNSNSLDSATYMDAMLPELPDSVPSLISHLVNATLIKSNKRRIDAETAATICQIYLWAPKEWITANSKVAIPTGAEIVHWLLLLTNKVVKKVKSNDENLEVTTNPAEDRLIATFLRRVNFAVIKRALYWIRENI